LLPLVGSIPIADAELDLPVNPELWGVRVGADDKRLRHDCWWFGMFGALHPEWSPEPLFSYIARAATELDRRVVIASIGRLGPGSWLWQDLQSRYGSRFSFATLGERSTLEISKFLQFIDYGISTTPWGLVNKSATVAAMLDHGLPVIVSRDDVHFRTALPEDSVVEPLLYKMDERLPEWLAGPSVRRKARERLSEMTDRFLLDLTAAA
jgi:hypothetical protein